MTRPTVILDACTLIPIRLATSLLWLAESGLFEPLWSEEILNEVERNLPEASGITREQAAQRLGNMRKAFGPEATVTGFESRIADMTCDPKDRHVLAAAVHDLDIARALTYSPRDFGDYVWAIQTVAERSLSSRIVPAVDAPDQIAFMRFIPQVSRPSHVIESFVTSMTFLTLVRVEDGTWRVWGLGPGMPAARRVLGRD